MIKYLNLKIVKMVNFMLFVSCVRAKSLQSCLTLCDPMSCGLPGSSVQGILQARILKWVAMWNGLPCGMGCHAFLQGLFLTQESNFRLFCFLHWQVGSLPVVPPGKPYLHFTTDYKKKESIF